MAGQDLRTDQLLAHLAVLPEPQALEEEPPEEEAYLEAPVEDGEEGADTFRWYLNRAAAYPLLTLEEEVELARKVAEGKEAAQALAAALNLSEEEVFLAARFGLEETALGGASLEKAAEASRKVRSLLLDREAKRLYLVLREGEVARGKLARHNLRLVVSVAKSFLRRYPGLSLSDLVAMGNVGLLVAVDRFDWRKRFRFSTYATWWIRQAITRGASAEARSLRLPAHKEGELAAFFRARAELRARLKRDPTLEEVAQALGVPPAQLDRLLWETQEALYLDQPVGEDGTPFGDFVAHEGPYPEERAFQARLGEDLQQALSALPERERLVLSLRSGLVDGREWTLEEVARVMGVTRERVRQIEGRARRRFLHHHAKRLRDYLD